MLRSRNSNRNEVMDDAGAIFERLAVLEYASQARTSYGERAFSCVNEWNDDS